MGHRDLKNSPRSARARATSPRSSGGGVMMGIVIGLIVGVAAVVGVVMYFSRAATPFSNLQKLERSTSDTAASTPTQMLEPGTSINSASASAGPVEAPPAPAPAAPNTASAPGNTKPATAKAKPGAPAQPNSDVQRFDFYKILPGQVDAAGGNDHAASAAASAETPTSKHPYLQLGSFQNQDDADNLKAKLALMGIEASIQSVNVAGKGMVHRVRVGPFARQEDLDHIKSQLKQDGINLTVKTAN